MIFISRKIVFHPNLRFLVNINEKWLSQMAKSGCLLVDFRGWFFEFERVKSCDKKYFMYSTFDASKGMSFDYHLAKQKYSKSSSRLNKKIFCVFEVDFKKLDEQFLQYVKQRNAYYINFYIKLFVFSMILSLLCLFTSFYIKHWHVILIIPMLISVYSIIATLILKRSTSQGTVR